jgi:hypothetical protein
MIPFRVAGMPPILLESTQVTTAYPLHTAALQIAIADHRPQYDDVAIDSDDVILHAIIARTLQIAADCPAEKLAALYDMWNAQTEDHPIHSLAICRVLEILEPILELTGATVPSVPVPAVAADLETA